MSQRVPKLLVCTMSFMVNFKSLPHIAGTSKFEKILISYGDTILTFSRTTDDENMNTKRTILRTALVRFRPYSCQFWPLMTFNVAYHWRLKSVFHGDIKSHKTIYRTSQSISVWYVVTKNLPEHHSYAIIIRVSYMHSSVYGYLALLHQFTEKISLLDRIYLTSVLSRTYPTSILDVQF